MPNQNNNINKIATQASLKIYADDKAVAIKNRIYLGNKSSFGVVLFLFIGLLFIILPFIATSDTVSKIIGIILGLSLLILSMLTLLREVMDGVEIKDNCITIRYNLKRSIIPLNGNMMIIMKSEVIKVRRSSFIIVTHFLQDRKKELPILRFQMDQINTGKAQSLGDYLTKLLNDKIRQE